MPQISATLSFETAQAISDIAKNENRTFSQMVQILLDKAIKEKNRKKSNLTTKN